MLLVRLINEIRTEEWATDQEAQEWKNVDPFQVKKVAWQSFLMSFWSANFFDKFCCKRWGWLSIDVMMVCIWDPSMDISDDPLDSIPIWVTLHTSLLNSGA